MRMTLALAMLVCVAGCAKPAAEVEAPTVNAAAAQAEPKRLVACDLVSADEMSTIVAVAMKATVDEENPTKCTYQPTSGASMPMIELAVDVGGGEAAMVAGKMLKRVEHGELNDPLHGVGDEAWVVGPESMIRRGEDLVRIMVFGADDSLAATRKIFALADAKLL